MSNGTPFAATAAAALAPVRHTVRVALDATAAFELFTARLDSWWPLLTHSCSQKRDAKVSFEPRVDAPVLEHAPDGTVHAWGRITRWDPPHAFAMSWHPGHAVEEATRLCVTFTPRDGGCEVSVLHDGWEARGDNAARMREGYDSGWPMVLRCFVEKAR